MADGTRIKGLNNCKLVYCEVLAWTMYHSPIIKNETLLSE